MLSCSACIVWTSSWRPNLCTYSNSRYDCLRLLTPFLAQCVTVSVLSLASTLCLRVHYPSRSVWVCECFGGGLSLTYKSVADYLTAIRVKPADHQGFMRAQKTFIQKRVDSPGLQRLRDQKSLKNAQTVDATKEEGRVWERQWDFVEKDTWIEENRHKLSKEDLEKQEFVKTVLDDGSQVEGVWERVGKKGRHRVKDYSKQSVEHRTSIEDGSNVLDEQQAHNKYTALAGVFRKDSKDTEKKALDSTQLVDMLKALNLSQGTGSTRAGGSEEDPDLFRDASDDNGSDSSTDFEAMQDEAAAILGKRKAKTAAPSSAVKSKQAKSAGSGGGGGAASVVSKGSAGASAPIRAPAVALHSMASSSKASLPSASPPDRQRAAAQLDGRTENLRKGLDEQIYEMTTLLADIREFDESMGALEDGKRGEMQIKMKQRSKDASTVLTRVGRADIGKQSLRFLQRFCKPGSSQKGAPASEISRHRVFLPCCWCGERFRQRCFLCAQLRLRACLLACLSEAAEATRKPWSLRFPHPQSSEFFFGDPFVEGVKLCEAPKPSCRRAEERGVARSAAEAPRETAGMLY